MSSLSSYLIFFCSGFIQFPANYFTGGPFFDMSFQMRTDRANGLLLYTYGAPGVYWLVQLVDGGLFIELSTGDERKNLTFPANTNNVNLCDGRWHQIAVKKRRELLEITVNYKNTVDNGDRGTDLLIVSLSSYLWIGGIMPESEAEESLLINGLQDKIQPSKKI